MSKFEPGKTYYTRSACDHNCMFKATVISRTDKSVRIKNDRGTSTKRIQVWNGIEQIKPYGAYSMAPVISADRVYSA